MTLRRLYGFSLLLCSLISLGCEPSLAPGRGCNPRNSWGSSSYSSSDSNWLYLNFYEYYEKYPGYGVAIYEHDSGRDESFGDLDLISDSVRRVREEYGKAHSEGRVSRWDSTLNRETRITIDYVVVLLDDRNPETSEHPQVGEVFPAKEVFDTNCPLQDIVDQAVLEKGVLRKDDPITPEEKLNGFSTSKKARFQIIERHMKK